MSGDRYAWKNMVYTQELVNYLKSAKKELQELFSKGAFCGENVDTTAMSHVDIIGRCIEIDDVIELVDEGVPSEEEEDQKEETAKDYKDA